jgi:leucyl-tRNA synthetase
VAMLVLGELLQDVDFSFSMLKGIYAKLNEIHKFYSTFYNGNKTLIDAFGEIDDKKKFLELSDLGLEDHWLIWRIKYNIKEISNSFERLKIRESLNTALYMMDKDFEWFKKRKLAKSEKLCQGKKDVLVVHHYLTKRIKLLSPFCPFLAEELWHLYGNKQSIFNSSWPTIEDKFVNDSVFEENELYLSNILTDLNNIIKVTKNVSINKIFIYLSSEEKNNLYHKILKLLLSQNINKNFGELMKLLLSNSNGDTEKHRFIKNNTNYIKKTLDDIHSLAPSDRERRQNIGTFDEFKPLNDAISLLSREYKISSENIIIYRENQDKIIDPGNKARFSRPYKPAIFIQ